MKSVAKGVEHALFMLAVLIMICASVCQIFHLKPAVVLSGSMEPEIKTGSLVFINTGQKEIKEGDVITFRNGPLLVTHRVIEVTGDGYVTKGDNNKVADAGIVKKQDVEGKPVLVIPALGYIIKTAAVPSAIAAVLLYVFMKVINKGEDYD